MTDWSEQRRADVLARAELAARARTAEVDQARALVAGFVARVRDQRLATTALRARGGDSRETYSTGLTGWYLRRDGTLAVADDGELYTLVVARSLRARVTGVRLAPDEPRLQAGIGARDGESVALATLLDLRLAAGDDWPLHRR